MSQQTIDHQGRRRRRPAPEGTSRPSVARRAVAIFEAPSRRRVLDRDHTYRRLLVAADLMAATLAIILAIGVIGHDRVRGTVLLIIPLVLLAGKLLGLYDRDEFVLRKSTLDESPALFQLATLYTLSIVVLGEVLVDGPLGTDQIVGLWMLLFTFAFAFRLMARHVGHRIAPSERCVVVGDLRGTGAVADRFASGAGVNAEVVAFVPLDLEQDHRRDMAALREAIVEHDADRVILAPQSHDSDAVLDAIRMVKSVGVKVSLLPRLFEVVGSSVLFDDVNGVTVLGVRRFGLSRSSRILKRATDLLGVGVGLLVVSPAMALIALAVRMDSKGPVFFRQTRVGRDGRHFEMLKFRTMVDGADAMKASLRDQSVEGGLFKIADDPRITRAGRFLRKTSLDELPQLLNVLKGDMALVGPRPLVADEDALVRGWHRRRLHLTPGMTGPWQVLGKRVPLQEMVKIDYLYIATWSLWNDVKIMVRTVLHMLHRGGL